MLDFIANNAGMIGLFIFFIFFIGVVAGTYWPGKSKTLQEHADIPLKEDDDE